MRKSKVVTVTYEEKIPQIYVEKGLFSCLSYELFITFLPEKQLLSLAKNLNSPSVRDENKSL